MRLVVQVRNPACPLEMWRRRGREGKDGEVAQTSGGLQEKGGAVGAEEGWTEAGRRRDVYG